MAAGKSSLRCRPRRWIASAIVMVAATLTAVGSLDPASSGAAALPDDWPMFHRDERHSGLARDTTLAASNVASLATRWMAQTGSQSFTSPAVVYNATLGRDLVYQGSQSGTFAAYDAATGERVWYFKVAAHIQSSPAVVNGVVYFGASDHNLYALDATTGALICSGNVGGVISASPVVVDPDGTGLVAYFGDNGVTGSDDGGHVHAVNAVDPNGAADCSLKWTFDGFGVPPGSDEQAGSWSPPGFAKDKDGRPVVVFGSSSPDNAVYAVDARTGELLWRFQTKVYFIDNDVGAGPTISKPGINGFDDGVVYIPGKNRIVYALNLRTGALLWEFNSRVDSPDVTAHMRSTPALLGNRLILGYGAGVYALDAVTGAKVWKTAETATPTPEVVSSPAISGPFGSRVVFVGDLAGTVHAYRASDGARLWSSQTGFFIYGSAAVAAGKAFISSADGYLYAFGLAGGASAPPDTTIASPIEGEIVANPAGDLTVSGTAADDTSVSSVLVAVKNRNTNKWWEATSGTWSPVFHQQEATLDTPGAASASWTATFPAPFGGGEFFVQAETVDADGQHDPQVPGVRFTIAGLGAPPETTIDEPVNKEVVHFPGGERQRFAVALRGTATDPGGARLGIKKVNVVVKNREHGEYWCGPAGCGDGTSFDWSPTYKLLTATLVSPGAATTEWSLDVPVYDHPHSYFVMAWATDKDNEKDETRAMLGRFCVRDVGDPTCA